jgi:type I restriction enzyme, R subunit
VDISERSFEASIETALLAGGPDATPGSTGLAEPPASYGTYLPGGFRKRAPGQYDPLLCLDPAMVVAFVQATQPKRWEELAKHDGGEVKEQFVRRLSAEVGKRGVLDVLRKGVKDMGVGFDMAYFRPSSGLSPDRQMLYEGNIFTVVRQLRYSTRNDNSIDLAIFLNGLSLFTAELKNPLNGQNHQHAMAQYRQDRDPKEPLLAFGRCLAHFAADPEWVFVTTHLQAEDTRFLPFNKGKYGGAGNPPVPRHSR